MKKSTENIAKDLFQNWFSNPAIGYTGYHDMIQETLLDISPVSECPDFFKEIERLIRRQMKENPLNRRQACNHFLLALNDHKSMWS